MKLSILQCIALIASASFVCATPVAARFSNAEQVSEELTGDAVEIQQTTEQATEQSMFDGLFPTIPAEEAEAKDEEIEQPAEGEDGDDDKSGNSLRATLRAAGDCPFPANSVVLVSKTGAKVVGEKNGEFRAYSVKNAAGGVATITFNEYIVAVKQDADNVILPLTTTLTYAQIETQCAKGKARATAQPAGLARVPQFTETAVFKKSTLAGCPFPNYSVAYCNAQARMYYFQPTGAVDVSSIASYMPMTQRLADDPASADAAKKIAQRARIKFVSDGTNDDCDKIALCKPNNAAPALGAAQAAVPATAAACPFPDGSYVAALKTGAGAVTATTPAASFDVYSIVGGRSAVASLARYMVSIKQGRNAGSIESTPVEILHPANALAQVKACVGKSSAQKLGAFAAAPSFTDKAVFVPKAAADKCKLTSNTMYYCDIDAKLSLVGTGVAPVSTIQSYAAKQWATQTIAGKTVMKRAAIFMLSTRAECDQITPCQAAAVAAKSFEFPIAAKSTEEQES